MKLSFDHKTENYFETVVRYISPTYAIACYIANIYINVMHKYMALY